METSYPTWAWIALTLGLAIRYIVNRRKFNRRAVTGVEQFGSYEKFVATSFVERVFKLIGLGLIVIGLFALMGKWLEKSREREEKMENTRPLK